ncbi:hypothetical protein [Aurantimonas sp. HBX-1]|uniref:hypothetical protein n=1 Tax=Aurantimonas sp. HBX-1 TaxID=2906072 RepID=UPI001F2ADAED|nr:hypothetical protein [Aurantimonas sp. HBX-1]UIJ73892.1 hypothetical protein LXB15_09865 [Aurantimonas sp. HBX-1]
MRSVTGLLALLICLVGPGAITAANAEIGDGALELGLPLDGTAVTDLTETRARPLFAPSRRQLPPPAVPVARPVAVRQPVQPVPLPPPDIQLLGVIAIGGEMTALVSSPGSDRMLRLKSGDHYQGWTATISDLKTLEFQLDGRNRTFRLFEPE